MTPLQRLTENVGNLGINILATGFEKLPKVQQIVQSDHTGLTALVPSCSRFAASLNSPIWRILKRHIEHENNRQKSVKVAQK